MKIAVIGSGIAGLTFAAAMRHFAPTVSLELYERDPDASSSTQGYSLGLKGDAGIMVLKELGLYTQIRDEAITVTNFIFNDQQGHPLLELPSTNDETRLTQRVRRQRLKAILLDAVKDTPIFYGKSCTGYQQSNDQVDVQFADGQSVQADYVVDCEGVASVIRQQMIGDNKKYLGLAAIVGDAPIELEHPLLAGGYFMTLGDAGSSVFCYRQAGGVHLSYTSHIADVEKLRSQTPDALLKVVQQATLGWHTPIPALAAALDPASLVVRGYYDKDPIQHVHEGRVWLIGDAAHQMTPFQGQGANMAMVDALKLAEFFADPAASPAKADTVDAEIVKRGRKAVLESRQAAVQFHNTNWLQQYMRNVGFRTGNFFIKLFSQK